MILDELIDIWLLDISIETHYRQQHAVITSRISVANIAVTQISRNTQCHHYQPHNSGHFLPRQTKKSQVWNWYLYIPQLNSQCPAQADVPRAGHNHLTAWTKKNVPKFLNDLKIYRNKALQQRDATYILHITHYTGNDWIHFTLSVYDIIISSEIEPTHRPRTFFKSLGDLIYQMHI